MKTAPDALLGIQVRAGNRAAAHVATGLRSRIQRWGSLGDEHYHSPPHTEDGVGIIAGVPEPGQGRVVTKSQPIMYGDATARGQLRGEAEWRQLLGSGGNHAAIAVYAFLRAAMLDDAAWLPHVRSHYDGIPPQAELVREVGTNFSTADRRIRRPTDEEQMALAKAIYLRGQTGIGFDFDRYSGMDVLMQEFLAKWQPRLIERMAAADMVLGHEHLRPVTRATTYRQQAAMVGAAQGTLTRAIGTFAAWHVVEREARPRVRDAPSVRDQKRTAQQRAEHEKMMAQRRAEMAGQTLRGVGDTAADIRREQIAMWKNVFDIALAAIPIPGAGQLVGRTILGLGEGAVRTAVEATVQKITDTLAKDRVKNALAEAFATEDHTDRINKIRTEAVWTVRQFNLGNEEDDMVNTINGTLMGTGR